MNPGNVNKMVTPAETEAALKITIKRKQMVKKQRAQSCSWYSPVQWDLFCYPFKSKRCECTFLS
jgi:hypothetical protein